MQTRRQALAAASVPFLPRVGGRGAEDDVASVLNLLDAQVDLRTGGLGEKAVAALIQSRLEEAGFETRTQSVEAPVFSARRCVVVTPSGETPAAPQEPARLTGPSGVEGSLALWTGQEDSARVEGALAVVMLPFARHSQLDSPPIRSRLDAVTAAGARGAVLITDGPTGETIRLNAPPPGQTGFPAIPTVTVGPNPGAEVLAAARAGLPGRLVLDGETRTVLSENIWGVLRRGAGWTVVSTPRTGWTPAAAERGPGLAAFLTLTRRARRFPGSRSILFVCTTAHEYDNAGSHAFFEVHAPPPSDVGLWAHLGAGFGARDHHELGGWRLSPLNSPDPQRFLLGSPQIVPVLARAFAGQPGLERPYPAQMGARGELAEVLTRGYSPAFGLFGAHRYHHVASDRSDKAHPRAVVAATTAVERVVHALS